MDQRLKKKTTSSKNTVEIPLATPVVRVASPQLNMDTTAFADAIESLAIAINQLGQQQAAMLQQMAESNKLLAELAKTPSNVQVAAPNVSMPPRPRSFTVEVDDENGNTQRMRIQADSPN